MIAINQGKIANVEEMISEVQEVIDTNMAINQQMIADNQDRISANSKLVRKALQIIEVVHAPFLKSDFAQESKSKSPTKVIFLFFVCIGP